MADKKTRTKTVKGTDKKVTRYTYQNIKEPRTPETGHTSLLPSDEQVVTLPMDNGWSKSIQVGKLSQNDERAAVMDMDPAADPVLFWAVSATDVKCRSCRFNATKSSQTHASRRS